MSVQIAFPFFSAFTQLTVFFLGWKIATELGIVISLFSQNHVTSSCNWQVLVTLLLLNFYWNLRFASHFLVMYLDSIPALYINNSKKCCNVSHFYCVFPSALSALI